MKADRQQAQDSTQENTRPKQTGCGNGWRQSRIPFPTGLKLFFAFTPSRCLGGTLGSGFGSCPVLAQLCVCGGN